MIGIAGGSGSGKTTFARMLRAHLGEEFCGWLAQDQYYREHPAALRGRVNYDHPDALEFSLLEQHLAALKSGQDVEIPHYDFSTHSRTSEVTVFTAKPVILVDGILLLSQPQIRRFFDFSFFIHTDEEVRFRRRMKRDVEERGRTSEGVRCQFLSQVKPMHDQFVEPSRHFATNVVSGEKSFGPEIERIVYGLTSNATSHQNLDGRES